MDTFPGKTHFRNKKQALVCWFRPRELISRHVICAVSAFRSRFPLRLAKRKKETGKGNVKKGKGNGIRQRETMWSSAREGGHRRARPAAVVEVRWYPGLDLHGSVCLPRTLQLLQNASSQSLSVSADLS